MEMLAVTTINALHP
jgi:hypothetical protein